MSNENGNVTKAENFDLLRGVVLLRRGEFQEERLRMEREKLGLRRDQFNKVSEEEHWRRAESGENRREGISLEREKEELDRQVEAVLGVR